MSNFAKEVELLSEEEGKEKYGWGRYHPDSLQKLNSPKWATAFFCLASLVQGVTVNGLLHFFLPMIERRFRLSSTESGFMSGAYDLAAMIFVIPATYLGGRPGSHRPRYVGCGMLVMGTGSLIFSLPAFFGGIYGRAVQKDICDPEGIYTQSEVDEGTSLLFWVLFIGNFLHGIGASPLYTLAVTYIDDNVPVEQASLYFGFYFMMAVIGPFLGMVGGGLLSQVDGDIIRPNESGNRVELTPDSPAWVGCWWCGFIVIGICAYIFSIPILGLPAQLPDARKHREERVKLQNAVKGRRMSFTSAFQLPRAVLEVLKRVKFIFITAAACAEALIFSGMGAFLTKLLHVQFGLTPYEVAIYMCVITVPSTLLGISFGSSIIKIYRLGVREILLMNVILMILSTPCGFSVKISCPSTGVAGVSLEYNKVHPFRRLEEITLLHDCNRQCHCDERTYSPICGSDNMDYYSACFAGCRIEEKSKPKEMYRNCSCIKKKTEDVIDAVSGPCYVPCPMFPFFVVLIFVYLFLSFSALIPTITTTLRVVDTDVGSLALGVQWLFGRALGTIPGPILFGKAIDMSCVRWLPTKDGATGHCVLYQHDDLGWNLALLILLCKFVSIVCFSIALYLAHIEAKKANEIEAIND